jgi:hypothetical protein
MREVPGSNPTVSVSRRLWLSLFASPHPGVKIRTGRDKSHTMVPVCLQIHHSHSRLWSSMCKNHTWRRKLLGTLPPFLSQFAAYWWYDVATHLFPDEVMGENSRASNWICKSCFFFSWTSVLLRSPCWSWTGWTYQKTLSRPTWTQLWTLPQVTFTWGRVYMWLLKRKKHSCFRP